MSERITITEEGYKALQDELDFLKNVKKKEVKESIRVAKSFGDLSENSEYDAARTEQAQVESKIQELEETLKRVKVVSESDIKTDKVNVGAKVKIFNIDYNEEIEYMLVGSTEANPFENKISDSSPIGKAIIGAKVGDTVVVKLQKGDMKIKILAISK